MGGLWGDKMTFIHKTHLTVYQSHGLWMQGKLYSETTEMSCPWADAQYKSGRHDAERSSPAKTWKISDNSPPIGMFASDLGVIELNSLVAIKY